MLAAEMHRRAKERWGPILASLKCSKTTQVCTAVQMLQPLVGLVFKSADSQQRGSGSPMHAERSCARRLRFCPIGIALTWCCTCMAVERSSPKAPKIIFCSPGFAEAMPGQFMPTVRARKPPMETKAPPMMPIRKIFVADVLALPMPMSRHCKHHHALTLLQDSDCHEGFAGKSFRIYTG